MSGTPPFSGQAVSFSSFVVVAPSTTTTTSTSSPTIAHAHDEDASAAVLTHTDSLCKNNPLHFSSSYSCSSSFSGGDPSSAPPPRIVGGRSVNSKSTSNYSQLQNNTAQDFFFSSMHAYDGAFYPGTGADGSEFEGPIIINVNLLPPVSDQSLVLRQHGCCCCPSCSRHICSNSLGHRLLFRDEEKENRLPGFFTTLCEGSDFPFVVNSPSVDSCSPLRNNQSTDNEPTEVDAFVRPPTTTTTATTTTTDAASRAMMHRSSHTTTATSTTTLPSFGGIATFDGESNALVDDAGSRLRHRNSMRETTAIQQQQQEEEQQGLLPTFTHMTSGDSSSNSDPSSNTDEESEILQEEDHEHRHHYAIMASTVYDPLTKATASSTDVSHVAAGQQQRLCGDHAFAVNTTARCGLYEPEGIMGDERTSTMPVLFEKEQEEDEEEEEEDEEEEEEDEEEEEEEEEEQEEAGLPDNGDVTTTMSRVPIKNKYRQTPVSTSASWLCHYCRHPLLRPSSIHARRLFIQRIVRPLLTFSPDIIFISAGFDGHKFDQVGGAFGGLTEEDFRFFTSRLVRVAERVCEGRLVSVLEGGYNVEGGVTSAFATSVREHVRGLQRTAAGSAEPEELQFFPWLSEEEKAAALAKFGSLTLQRRVRRAAASHSDNHANISTDRSRGNVLTSSGPKNNLPSAEKSERQDGQVKEEISDWITISNTQERTGGSEVYEESGKKRKEARATAFSLEWEEAHKRRRKTGASDACKDDRECICSVAESGTCRTMAAGMGLVTTVTRVEETGEGSAMEAEMHWRSQPARDGYSSQASQLCHAQEIWQDDVEVGADALSDFTASDADECWELLAYAID